VKDSLDDVMDGYAMDPSLARLRRVSPIAWAMGAPPESCGVAVLADTPAFLTTREFAVVGEMFKDLSPRLIYVIKFWEGLPGLKGSEWKAAKALVAREVALTKPRAWLPCGPVSCGLLGVKAWQPAVAAIEVGYTRGGIPVVQGRWQHCKETVDMLLDPDAGFQKRG
jgi:hypothetical protein